jgi:predicted amidohydrolase
MDDTIVAAVQQQMRVYDTPEAYQEDIYRFLQLAHARRAELVVFPALSPVMLIPPLASNTKLSILKKSQAEASSFNNFLDRLLGRAATTALKAMGGVRKELARLLDEYPAELYEAYIDLFSAAALKYQVTIVAGSFYLRENEEANCKHVSYIFGPDGMILGAQEKVHLSVPEMSFCQAGQALHAIDTPVGKVGLLIGEDALFPETGRTLAYQRAELLVNLAACEGTSNYRQIRHAFLARVDENEMLGIQSCIVGLNLLNPQREDLVGRTGLLAPLPFSPGGDGVLHEIGATSGEGLLAEPIDREALRDYWARSEPRLRQSMRLLAYQNLASNYSKLRTLDQTYWLPQAEPQIDQVSDSLISPTAPPDSENAAGLEEIAAEPDEAGLDLSNAGRRLGLDLFASPFDDDSDPDRD